MVAACFPIGDRVITLWSALGNLFSVLHSIRYLHIVFTLQKIVQAKSCNISKDALT